MYTSNVHRESIDLTLGLNVLVWVRIIF